MSDQQTWEVLLEVDVDPDAFTTPEAWTWHELLACQPGEVRLRRATRLNTLEAAGKRQIDAYALYQDARETWLKVSAEEARLWLLREAAEYDGPGAVTGARFSTQYEYDDQGSYFESLSVALLDEGEEDIDYSEALESFGPEIIRRLFGAGEDDDVGTLTIAQARETTFDVDA